MRVAYFDAISGAAGDMILGSLLDAGLALQDLKVELDKLPLGGYTLTSEPCQKRQLVASQFLVHVQEADTHDHDHQRHGRSLAQIQELIGDSHLSATVKEMSAHIFRRLGEAEARVHGVPVSEVHFHEVGDVDSIVDIVGAAIALDLLHIDAVYCSPLPLGSGTIATRHGTYPIPAPATAELLADARTPIRPSAIQLEQVTPTGAAILTTVATFMQPPMRIECVGYGAGEADLDVPNVLRVWIGELESAGREHLQMVETNIDDMVPELYAAVVDRCFEAGALDVLLVPVIMKKSRPGIKLEILCRPEDSERLTSILLRETSTFGVRTHSVERVAADREQRMLHTEYGDVSVKVKYMNGSAVGLSPEYEDCRRVAIAAHVPVIDVYQAALSAGRLLVEPQE